MTGKSSKNKISVYKISRYQDSYKNVWNEFIATSKNATFLFNRDFMEYHSDRFRDFSLMIFKDEKLKAVLPANIRENSVYSHQGLSYGGLILKKTIIFEEVAKLFQEVLQFFEKEHIGRLYLKLLPEFYHTLPSNEMDQLLFLTKAELVRTDITSTIFYEDKLEITSSNRLRGIKKAIKHDLEVKEESEFETFWQEVLEPNLMEVHHKKPIHSLQEIALLHSRFPENIRQFNIYERNEILGGVTIFETETTAHAQYISANEAGRKLGALDFLFDYLIKQFNYKRYFDFGISTENQGKTINKGLLNWKESFGGRSYVHRFFEVETANYPLLKNIYL